LAQALSDPVASEGECRSMSAPWDADANSGMLQGWSAGESPFAPASRASPTADVGIGTASSSWQADETSGMMQGWGDSSFAVQAAPVVPGGLLSEADVRSLRVREDAPPVSSTACTGRGARAEDLFADWRGEESAVPEAMDLAEPGTDGGGVSDSADFTEATALRCSKNHALQPIEACSDGQCDRCGQDVLTGSPVMACCPCDFWLCAECLAQDPADLMDHIEDPELSAMLEKGVDGMMQEYVEKVRTLLRDQGAFNDLCEQGAVIATGAGKGSCVGGSQVPIGGLMLTTAEELRVALNCVCKRCELDEVDEEEAQEIFDGPMDVATFYLLAREYFASLCRTLSMNDCAVASMNE